MTPRPLLTLSALGCSLLVLMQSIAQANELQVDDATREVLQRRLAEQMEQINALKRSIAEQEARLQHLRRRVADGKLAGQRGRGQDATVANATQPPQPSAPQSSTPQSSTPQSSTPQSPAPQSQYPAPQPPAPARQPQIAQSSQQQAKESENKSQEPSTSSPTPLPKKPGVLTQPGKYVLEPSLQYSYSSANRVALIGYTVVPALMVGLVDVREVKRNTVTAALSGRTGLTNRLEVETRIPYVYRSDSTVSREIGTASSFDRTFETSGKGIGDVELGARYQLNDGGVEKPFYIGTLRFKTRTGRDPFEVVTDCVQRCIDNTTGTGLPLELPTGSGFYSLQGGVTWLFPSDPAVFFGSLTYLHNFKRTNVSRQVRNGEREFLGTIEPGAIVGFNFGMGLALNEKTTFTVGYDHNSIGRTRQAGQVVPGSVRTQLGTLLLGYSYRLDSKRTVNVSVGAGLTRDTPDLTLSIKIPFSN